MADDKNPEVGGPSGFDDGIKVDITSIGGMEVDPHIFASLRDELTAIQVTLQGMKITGAAAVAVNARDLHKVYNKSGSDNASRAEFDVAAAADRARQVVQDQEKSKEKLEQSEQDARQQLGYAGTTFDKVKRLFMRQPSGPSSGASTGGSDDYEEESHNDTPHQLRFEGQRYTAQDYGNALGQFLQGAGKRSGRQGLVSAGTAMRTFSNTIFPARSMLQNLGTQGQEFTSVGYEQGESPGHEVSGPLGLGFRLPGGASFKALGIRAGEWWQGLKPGITRGQVQEIDQGLTSQGWFQADPRFKHMRDSLEEVTKKNPLLLNQQTVEMMDKWVRMRGNKNLSDFVSTMKNIPEVAKAAHVSMAQMQADMDAWGDFARHNGGTYSEGAKAAQSFSRSTGLPGSVGLQLRQNPFIQAMTTLHTGLMPWEQSALPGGTQTQYAVEGLKQYYKTFGDMPSRKITDKYGRDTTVSGYRRKLGLMSQLTGMSTEELDKLLHGGGGDAGRVETEFRNWSKDVATAENVLKHDPSRKGVEAHLVNLFRTKGGTSKGWAGIRHEMSTLGFNQKEYESVRDAGKAWKPGQKVSAADQATARYKKFEEILQKKQKNTDDHPKVTIDLSARAATMFHLQVDNHKRRANAGQTSANIPYSGSGDQLIADPPMTGHMWDNNG